MHSLNIPILLLYFTLFCASLGLRAVLSFLETSITSLRLFKLQKLSRVLPSYQSFFTSLEQEPQRILISIVVANSLIDALTTALCLQIVYLIFAYFGLSGQVSLSLGIALSSITILLFGEIIPKTIARTKGDKLFFSILWIAYTLHYILYPLVTILLTMSNKLSMKYSKGKGNCDISEHEIRFLINYIHSKGLIETEKNKLLQNIFELGNISVNTIMIARDDICYISERSSIEEALTIFSQHKTSKLPVCQDSIDSIIGTLYLKDLVQAFFNRKSTKITELLQPVIFVNEHFKVNQVLFQFQTNQVKNAVIVTSDGITKGITTLKDVLKKIIGEIKEEYQINHSIQQKHVLNIIKQTTKDSIPSL